MRGLTVAGAVAVAAPGVGACSTLGQASPTGSSGAVGIDVARADTGLAGRLTTVPDRDPPSMPAGICTADRVTLVSASTVAEVPCVLLAQDITYLVH